MKTHTPSKKFRNVILILIGVTLLVLGYLYNNTLVFSDTIEDEHIIFKVPGAYKSDEIGQYYNDSTKMQAGVYYIPNDFGLTPDEMMDLEIAFWFTQDEVIDAYSADVNGQETRQIRYKDLQVGEDGLQYYYSGIITLIELESDYLLLDVYCAMDQSTGEKRDIKDSELKLINDIINSVEVKDYAQNIPQEKVKYSFDTLSLSLTDDWYNVTESGEYDQFDYGYGAFYEYDILPLWFDGFILNEENKNNLDEIQENMLYSVALGNYDYLGEKKLAGQRCIIYSYYGVESDSDLYLSGVIAFSENYQFDIYFYSYKSNFVLSDTTTYLLKKFILDSHK